MTDALLLMDFQTAIVGRITTGADELLATVNRAIAVARSREIPVIFVRVAFRTGAPEVSPASRAFAALRTQQSFCEDDEATLIHPTLDLRASDVVVTKRRVSAFAGSDLDVVLRAKGVNHLILAGIATSGVVLSTTRQAADWDFDLTILRDACADADAEVHRVLLDKVLARQAHVTSVQEWAQS